MKHIETFMENTTTRDIIITIPKNIACEDYQKEIDAVADGSQVMNFKVNSFPKTSIGAKCYLCHNGFIKGYMIICGMSEKNFTCTTTGRNWNGKFIERSGKFYPVEPIPMAGFRGYRYYQ